MKHSTKAALYSAFIFPGAGYFGVNSMIKGFSALIITMGCLSVFFYEAFNRAQTIAEKIVRGEIPSNYFALRSEIYSTPGVLSEQTISTLTYLLITIWIIGIVDSYRIGKKIDKKQTLNT
ncbi:MAG: hypothetical protein K6L73_13205 [Cellvibrionaceae bacterium]